MFALRGPIERDDTPRLCASLRMQIEHSGAALAVCELHALPRPDAVTVHTLARLQLTAGRLGCSMLLRNASPELCDLIDFMGLAHTIRHQPERSAQ